MAKILVMAQDSKHQDPNYRYYKGDIVCIREDSVEWGKEETLPLFLRVVIDKPVKDIDYLLNSDHEKDDETAPILKRRKYRMDLAESPWPERLFEYEASPVSIVPLIKIEDVIEKE